MSTTTYPIETILELAFAAHRVNKDYVKTSLADYNDSSNTVWANKELIKYNVPGIDVYPVANFVPLEITDADRECVAKLHLFFRRYTMLILGDCLNKFQLDMYEAYNMEECGIQHYGFFAYMPSFIKNEAAEVAYSRKLKVEYANSVHMHGKSFQGKVEIIKRIPLAQFDLFLYIAGTTSGKLVSFNTKDKFEVETVLDITARIKSQDTERTSRLPMTRINYVKVF
jgi:hypothetical protein